VKVEKIYHIDNLLFLLLGAVGGIAVPPLSSPPILVVLVPPVPLRIPVVVPVLVVFLVAVRSVPAAPAAVVRSVTPCPIIFQPPSSSCHSFFHYRASHQESARMSRHPRRPKFHTHSAGVSVLFAHIRHSELDIIYFSPIRFGTVHVQPVPSSPGSRRPFSHSPSRIRSIDLWSFLTSYFFSGFSHRSLLVSLKWLSDPLYCA